MGTLHLGRTAYRGREHWLNVPVQSRIRRLQTRGEMQEVNVEVRPDFLERQAKAQPVQALAELIWNGLDADATSRRDRE
jgi:hypothetical protein